MTDRFKEWSFKQLVVRWRHLSIQCWSYDAPSDEHFHKILGELNEISAELELRGYAYSLELNTWYDAVQY